MPPSCAFFEPVFVVAGYFTGRTLLQGQGLDAVRQRLRDSLWETVRTSWIFWPAVNVLNFALVPLEFRVLYANLASVGWTAHLTRRVHDHDDALVLAQVQQARSRTTGGQVLAFSRVEKHTEGGEESSP